MKRLTFILALSFFSFSTLAGSRDFEAHGDLVDSLKRVQSDVKTVGSIPLACLSCQAVVEPNKKIELNEAEVDLDRIEIFKRNIPFIVHLKRTKLTPEKVVLKFMNRHEVCEKLFIDSFPNLINGPLTAGCAVTKIIYSPHEIILDLKNYPLLVGGEDQVLELKFSKPDYTESYYDVDLSAIKGSASKIISKKERFFGNGYKVSLGAADSTPELKP